MFESDISLSLTDLWDCVYYATGQQSRVSAVGGMSHLLHRQLLSVCLQTFLVKASLNVPEKVRTDDASPDVSLQVRGWSLPQLSAGIRSIISIRYE